MRRPTVDGRFSSHFQFSGALSGSTGPMFASTASMPRSLPARFSVALCRRALPAGRWQPSGRLPSAARRHNPAGPSWRMCSLVSTTLQLLSSPGSGGVQSGKRGQDTARDAPAYGRGHVQTGSNHWRELPWKQAPEPVWNTPPRPPERLFPPARRRRWPAVARPGRQWASLYSAATPAPCRRRPRAPSSLRTPAIPWIGPARRPVRRLRDFRRWHTGRARTACVRAGTSSPIQQSGKK